MSGRRLKGFSQAVINSLSDNCLRPCLFSASHVASSLSEGTPEDSFTLLVGHGFQNTEMNIYRTPQQFLKALCLTK